MTKKILLSASLIMSAMIGNAQLYSSGNNLIAGSNVGIGINLPVVKLHVKNNVSSELLRLETSLSTGFGKFTLQNMVVGMRVVLQVLHRSFPLPICLASAIIMDLCLYQIAVQLVFRCIKQAPMC